MHEAGDSFAAHVNLLLTKSHTLRPVDHPSSIVALLGIDHKSTRNFKQLVEPYTLHMSEVYEYACRLEDNQHFFVSLQPFKMAYAFSLTDVHLLANSKAYVEILG